MRRVPACFLILLLLVVVIPCKGNASELSVLCARGDILAVRQALAEGADPDETDVQGYTPLMYTVRAGIRSPLSMHFKIIELLIEAGADINASVDVVPSSDDSPVRTLAPLHWTLLKGENFEEMTLLLLEKGADPNLPGVLGRPLHIAAGSGTIHSNPIDLLLKWGADADLPDLWGIGPLVNAVAASNPSPQAVERLLDAGVDINETFDIGEHKRISVLMLASMNSAPVVVRLLLERGAQKSALSAQGLSAYDYALLADMPENAELLK